MRGVQPFEKAGRFGQIEFRIARFDAKLSNAAFIAKAPEEVIEEQKEKRDEAAALAARLNEALKRLTK